MYTNKIVSCSDTQEFKRFLAEEDMECSSLFGVVRMFDALKRSCHSSHSKYKEVSRSDNGKHMYAPYSVIYMGDICMH